MKQRNIFYNIKQQRQSGFTLIELLLYVLIMGGVLTAATIFFATVLESRVKNQSISEVNQQATLIMDRLSAIVRNAVSISSPASGASGSTLNTVVYTSSLSPTIVNVNGTALQVKEGTATAVPITNNKVQVDAVTFTNLTRSGTPGTIRISLTLSRSNISNRNEYSYQKTFVTTATLRWP